jgi:HEAT repeat protein
MASQTEELVAQLIGGDDARAEAAVKAFASLSPESGVEAFDILSSLAVPKNGENAQRSADSDASAVDRRCWAVQALAALPHADTTPVLIAALQDPAPEVRQCAALALRLHPDPRAAQPLAAALADPDALSARLAVDALAAIGQPAVPALLDVLAVDSPSARLGALRALAAIGDTRAIPALFAALDGTTLEEYWASAALERMGVGMSFFNPGS